MTVRRRSTLPALLALVLVMAACGGGTTPSGGSSGASESIDPSASTSLAPPDRGAPVTIGPVPFPPPAIDPTADIGRALVVIEAQDQERIRAQAGFPILVGPGWGALSGAADAALDSAARSLSDELGIESPIGSRDGQVASVGGDGPTEPRASASVAAATAIVMASLITAQSLGSGGTKETSKSTTETTTQGDEVATMTAKLKGKVVSTGSRVVGDFTVELTGQVTNSVTGATTQMTGSATAHVEIDGCPDASGSSKGRMSLSSKEEVVGQNAEGAVRAGWTRDLSGQFDISVDDEASISGLALDVEASESVSASGGGEADSGHDLGIKGHSEFTSGPNFTALAFDEGASTGEVTTERDATQADLVSLFRSAAYGISVAAVGLGQEAERFWRGGKCVELIIDPEGGDVDADSVTDVVAKVKHKFEGNELDKPVEATLVGVATIDPVGQRQAAPATVKFTAGSDDGDVGEIDFKTVSNRGIAEKAVKFTVRPAAWKVTFKGTDTEVFGPVSNKFKADITDLRITAAEKVLSGTGKLHLKGTVTSGPCTGPLDQVATSTVTGTLVGTGPEALLRIVIRSASPPGGVVKMRCKPGGGADIAAEGHAERFGEALMEFDLPAVDGTANVSKKAAIGGIFNVTVKGSFTVTVDKGS